MALPLSTILRTAPGLISAAADLIGIIRRKKDPDRSPELAKVEDLSSLVEQQAKLIEELALNNRDLVLAVRNNRIIALASLVVALLALVMQFWPG